MVALLKYSEKTTSTAKSKDVQYVYFYFFNQFSLIISLIVSNETAIKVTGEESCTELIWHCTLIFLCSSNYYVQSRTLENFLLRLFLDLCSEHFLLFYKSKTKGMIKPRNTVSVVFWHLMCIMALWEMSVICFRDLDVDVDP